MGEQRILGHFVQAYTKYYLEYAKICKTVMQRVRSTDFVSNRMLARTVIAICLDGSDPSDTLRTLLFKR